jgi:hypothetical protein
VAIVSSLVAGSIALLGFGLDSVVEVSSALIIARRLSSWSAGERAGERAERRAVRLIAGCFFGIAAYVAFDPLATLLGLAAEPARSPVGLVLLTLSLVVMPTLAWAKRRVAAGLGSMALRADAAQTRLCTYLSAIVLLGLAANVVAGGGGWTRSRACWWQPLLSGRGWRPGAALERSLDALIAASHWDEPGFAICGSGLNQSPIDIGAMAVRPEAGPALDFLYQDSTLDVQYVGCMVEIIMPDSDTNTFRIASGSLRSALRTAGDVSRWRIEPRRTDRHFYDGWLTTPAYPEGSVNTHA